MFTIQRTIDPRRKLISLVCLTLILALLFSLTITVSADAASSYKVKSWKEGETHYYYVYKGSLPKYYYYNPTFCRNTWDIFKGSDGIKLSFYTGLYDVTDAKALAFVYYLGEKTINKQKSWSANYFSFNNGEQFYVYRIEGWYAQNSSANKLINAGLFVNEFGEKLDLIKIANGNVQNSQWDYIRNTLKCSLAFYFNTKSPKSGVTIGFKFYDSWGDPMDMYRP